MTTRTVQKKENNKSLKIRKKIFYTLMSFFLVVSSLYGYLIISATSDTVKRGLLENKISVLTEQVNELDLIYLNMIKGLDKEYAFSNGFTENQQNLYVSKGINHMAIR